MRPYPLSDLKAGRRIGKFEVRELFPEGRGGMSRVVRAVSLDGEGSEVALKISRTGSNQEYFYAALQKEVEVLRGLNHRGVVGLVPVSDGKRPYKERAIEILGAPWFFGMECLRGGSLDSLLEAMHPLTLEEAAAICHQLAMTLEYIHGQGFSHNDVKPDNVLFREPLVLGERFETVLIDFGVAAKLVRHQPDGSIVYMAPERLQEARTPNPPELIGRSDLTKADVWSLGILFYRMLAGKEPFLGVTDRSITSAILRGMPSSISSTREDVPSEIDAFLLDGCLAKDPRVRVSIPQVARFLDRYSGHWRVKRVPKRKRRFLWWRR